MRSSLSFSLNAWAMAGLPGDRISPAALRPLPAVRKNLRRSRVVGVLCWSSIRFSPRLCVPVERPPARSVSFRPAAPPEGRRAGSSLFVGLVLPARPAGLVRRRSLGFEGRSIARWIGVPSVALAAGLVTSCAAPRGRRGPRRSAASTAVWAPGVWPASGVMVFAWGGLRRQAEMIEAIGRTFRAMETAGE